MFLRGCAKSQLSKSRTGQRYPGEGGVYLVKGFARLSVALYFHWRLIVPFEYREQNDTSGRAQPTFRDVLSSSCVAFAVVRASFRASSVTTATEESDPVEKSGNLYALKTLHLLVLKNPSRLPY